MTMKMRWLNGIAAGGAVLAIGLCLLPCSWAQEPEDSPLSEAKFELQAQALEHAKHAVAEAKRAAAEAKRAARAHIQPPMMGPGMDAMSSIRQAAEGLRDAEGDDAKAEAEAKLRELLSDYFDSDMDRRVAELKAIEKRVELLREQLERRGDHKPEIIDLQVKVLVNEAEGLGFFSDTGPKGFIFTHSDDPWAAGGAPRFEITGPVAVPAAMPAPPASPARVRVEKPRRSREAADESEE
jgi:hypothetical protein